MIRKFIVLIILFTAVLSNTKGQIRSLLKKVDAVEFSAGPSLVSIHNKFITSDIREPKVGYNIGVGLVDSLSNRFYLTTRFSLVGKGHKTSYEVWYYDPTIDFDNCLCTTSLGESQNNTTLNYLNLELLARGYILRKKFFVELGPYVAYLIKGEIKSTQSWDNHTNIANVKDSFKNYDVGIVVSLGYEIFSFNLFSFGITVNNNFGLLDITPNESSKTESRTNSLSFLFGIKYQLNKKVNL